MAGVGSFIVVLVARSHDHMPLCSFIDENYKSSNSVQQHTRRILEKLTPASSRDSAASTPHSYQSFDHKDCVYFTLQDSNFGLTLIAAINKLLVHTTGVKELNELGCALLDTVISAFTQQFASEEYLSPSVKPYQFIRFDATLLKCVNKFTQPAVGAGLSPSDSKLTNRRGGGAGGPSSAWGQVDSNPSHSSSNPQYTQLRHEIAGVHDVIRRNYVDLMERGEKLEVMDTYSARLRQDSSQYYKTAVKMNRMRLWKMYGPPAVVAFVFFVFILYYFFM